ncbi:MAG: leucyl aminopeptidase [Burkholderiaceae bacterium]|nr:leucyl aminopeptidase [Burkholderiaceae bacterium]
MDFSIKAPDKASALNAEKTGCLVVGVFENKKLPQLTTALDRAGDIAAALRSGDISGKAGSTLLLHQTKGFAADRLLLVGLGKDGAIADKDFSQAASAIANAFTTLGAKDAIVALPLSEVKERDSGWAIRQCVSAVHDKAYRSDTMKSKRDAAPQGVKKIALTVAVDAASGARTALAQAQAIAHGVALARDLGNLPGNICTPTYLAATARKLAKSHQLSAEVLDHKQIEALKMGSFLSVAKGSDEPPKFIVLKYQGGQAKEAPAVLVGKGLTFDAGGISLKPGAGMDEMKFDMCGAAAVLGTLQAVAELKLPQNVIGVIPSCENMPSGRANKPGDIVTSMAGQTIEILNTDAEGRLLLCDALTYTERFKPSVVIDVATLTGACVTALGHHNSGLFTRHDDAHDALAEELLSAGKASGDTAWRMPIEDSYQEQLKSNFADIANIGGPPAGSITAACFLERFTKKYTWAHLDIAGTAWKSGAAKGATGRPVPMLTEFLIQRSAKKPKRK